MDTLTNYICPELLVLVPVLYFIGIMIKCSKIPDKYIPLTLGGIGVVLSTVYVLSQGAADNIALAAFTAITQGILCAGCSVYFNQLIKQRHE